jgi:predicted metalloprotease
MRLDGRRESSNVEDRRGMSGGKKAGLGIGGIIIAMAIAYFTGGNPLEAGMQAAQQSMGQNTEVSEGQQREFTEEEQALAKFSTQILAGTEDVWTKIFKEQGAAYQVPTMVLYTDGTATACGQGSAAMGPFYCSGDQKLYIDLSFFTTMKKQLGADGDFAYAYVIAHEVGHHVEYLTGTLQKVHEQMARLSQAEANKLSVRLELLADFYAGVWAHHDNKMFRSLEDGDIEEAINCAEVIGDDYLQKKARGYAVPESFNHGTSKQRMKWFKLGLETGDISKGTTFQCSDAEL